MNEVYLYALIANLCFALGSVAFTHYARKVSSIWMNFIKALVATLCFGLLITYLDSWHNLSTPQLGMFFLSGCIGLGVGDIFLFKGFSELGPGRSIMIFGFQPIILGFLGFLFLNQSIETNQLLAIVFLILCLFVFSLERYRKNGSWQLYGLAFVLLGVIFDAIGVLITRQAFEMDTLASSYEANFYRCLGAIFIMLLIKPLVPFNIVSNLQLLNLKSKAILTLGSIMGTFLSLAFYLKAIQTGNLAVVSAIAITGSLFSSIFECVYEKKLPSRYLILAFLFFLIGVKLLLK